MRKLLGFVAAAGIFGGLLYLEQVSVSKGHAQGAPSTGGGSGSGTVTSVSGTAPIVSNGSGTAPAISCTTAGLGDGGCLSATTQNIDGQKTFLVATIFDGGLTTSTEAASGQITSNVASGSVAYSMLQGARFVTNGATATRYFSDDGSDITTPASIHATGGLKANGTISGGLGSSDSFVAQTNGKYWMDGASAVYMRYVVATGIELTGADVIVGTATAALKLPYTDSSGTPGAATINKAAGKSAVAAGAASVVITNSLVAATSVVSIMPWQSSVVDCAGYFVTPTAGSFTVTCPSGNAVSNWLFSWKVTKTY